MEFSGHHFGKTPVDEFPLTEELCEFIGAVIGDGCVSGYTKQSGKPNYHISVTGDANLDKDYLVNRLAPLARKLFGATANPSFRKDSNAIILNIYSKFAFSLLTERFEFVPGEKTLTVKIPEEILVSKKSFIYAAIRGIADTDGCVYIDERNIYRKPYGRIHLVTYSKPLFSQLKEILSADFSIYCSKSKTDWNDRYDIVIYGNGQIKKWVELIGFSNEKHLRKVKHILEPEEGFEPPTRTLQECSSTVELLWQTH